MNRKKAILMVAALESFLLAMLLVLFFSGALGLHAFLIAAIALGFVSTGVMFVVFKNTEP